MAAKRFFGVPFLKHPATELVQDLERISLPSGGISSGPQTARMPPNAPTVPEGEVHGFEDGFGAVLEKRLRLRKSDTSRRLDRPHLDRSLPPRSAAQHAQSQGESAHRVLEKGAVREERPGERELILCRLERYGGSVKAARESLGLTKTTFHRYMKTLGISAGGASQED